MRSNNTVLLPDGFNDIVIRDDVMTVYFNNQEFEKPLPFTLESLTDVIRTLPCNGMRLPKDADAEKFRMPPLILTFYRDIFKFTSVPTDLILAETHINRYFDHLNGNFLRLKGEYTVTRNEYSTFPVSAEGVKNRILRMYPSLIRDFHFHLLCHTSGKFSEVIYSLVADFRGYDLRVRVGGKELLVRLMADTNRSNQYNQLKYQRHVLEHNIFDLKINVASERKIGEFYLYNDKHIQLLINHLNGENGS